MQYRYAVSHVLPTISHPVRSRNLDKGLGEQPPLSSTTMSSYSPSPYRIHILSPAHSTPSLDDNLDDTLYYSPPETYLDTPDLPAYDWKEIRRLEDRKLYLQLQENEVTTLGLYNDVDLPSLADVSSNKAPLPLELPPAPASWQPTTISPEEAFYDYEQVRQFMADQARPSSPSVYSACSSYLVTPYNETKELPSIEGEEEYDDRSYAVDHTSPEDAFVSLSLATDTSSGTKRQREDPNDADYDVDHDGDEGHLSKPARPSKRRRSRLDDVADPDYARTPERDRVLDDDDSGEFKPRTTHPNKKYRTTRSVSRRAPTRSNLSQKSSVKSRTQTHGKTEDQYRLGPCDCRRSGCSSCEMTCWYKFIRGPREGQLCRRLFESGRHLDLRRHKISHAVNEWQMLENGEVTLEEAWWYAVEYNCEHQGLICPNGDCKTTFTRYDALRRHMERQTCPYWHLSSYPNLDSRSVKTQIERDSKEKYARISASKQS